MTQLIATKDYDNKTLVIEMTGKTNSFTSAFLTELEQWLDHAELDKQLNSIILTGKGGIFSVGGDIFEMKDELSGGKPDGYVNRIVPHINRIIKKIICHPLIIISAINGSAAGGGLSLALCCDYKISVNEAKLAFAFSLLDLTPDSGSSMSFVRSFGYSKALINLLRSNVLTGEDAYKMNAIDFLATTDNLIEMAMKIASEIAKVDRAIVSKTKELLNYEILQTLDQRLESEYFAIKKSSKSQSFAKKLSRVIESMK